MARKISLIKYNKPHKKHFEYGLYEFSFKSSQFSHEFIFTKHAVKLFLKPFKVYFSSTLGIKMHEHGVFNCVHVSLKAARRSLLILFLLTALPCFLETATPIQVFCEGKYNNVI